MYPFEIARLLMAAILILAILALRYRPRLLPLVALAAVALFWLPAAQTVQRWNVYHYWINAKYINELGYTQLYNCTAAALPFLAAAPARNLDTYTYTTAAALPPCQAEFSPERWQQFRADLAWLQANGRGPGIEDAIRDKGLNTTPAWLALAAPLAHLPAGSPLWSLVLNADLILLLLAAAAIARTMGRQPAALAVLVLATWPGGSGFITGHWLQWVWLAALMGALAAWKRGNVATSGALIALASVDRIFPGALFLWPLLNWHRVPRRFWGGAAAVGAAALIAGSLTPAGPALWGQFLAKMAAHSAAISGEAGVHIGLRNLASMMANPAHSIATWRAFGAGEIAPGLTTAAPGWTWLPAAVFAALALLALARRRVYQFSDAIWLIFPALTLSHYYYTILALSAAENGRNNATQLLTINLIMVILLYFALDPLAAYAIGQFLICIYIYRRMTKCLTSQSRLASLSAA